MRKAFILLAVGLLVLAVAAPATAAPEPGKNKFVATWEIDCSGSNMPELGTFTVHAKGVPGWPTDAWSATPIHYRQGEFYVMEGGVLGDPFIVTPPPGLEDKLDLGPCSMHLAGGPFDGFDLVSLDSWYVFQGKP
jgi:hypothetical protein